MEEHQGKEVFYELHLGNQIIDDHCLPWEEVEFEEYQGTKVFHELHPGNQKIDQACRLLNYHNHFKSLESPFYFHFGLLV